MDVVVKSEFLLAFIIPISALKLGALNLILKTYETGYETSRRGVRPFFRNAFFRGTFFCMHFFVAHFCVVHFFVARFFVVHFFVTHIFVFDFLRLFNFLFKHFFVLNFFRLCIFSFRPNFVAHYFVSTFSRSLIFSSSIFFVRNYFRRYIFSYVHNFVSHFFRTPILIRSIGFAYIGTLCPYTRDQNLVLIPVLIGHWRSRNDHVSLDITFTESMLTKYCWLTREFRSRGYSPPRAQLQAALCRRSQIFRRVPFLS